MATYYYDAQATGANNGSSKTDAFTTFAAAVAAANADGDIILGNAASQENLSASATYTFTSSVSVFFINFTTDALTDPYDVGGYIGHNSLARSVTITGSANTVYFSHLSYLCISGSIASFSLGASASGFNLVIGVLSADISTNLSSFVNFGNNNITNENRVIIERFRFIRRNSTRKIRNRCVTIISRLEISNTITVSDHLFDTSAAGAYLEIKNSDLSNLDSGTTLVGNCAHSPGIFIFNNCKLPTNYVLLGTQTSGVPSSGNATAYDCSTGDSHINFHYANAFGQVLVDTGKYADDNVGDANLSWKITTTAKVNRYTPFYVPYISRRHQTTGSVTPKFAIARDGSASAFTNGEVWAEFEAKETSGSVVMTTKSDKAADLATPTDQTTDAATTWTGLSGTNWKGTLGEQSFTVAENGFIRGRVVVGAPNAELWLDPQVRL